MKLELTKSQAQRLQEGALVKAYTEDNKSISLLLVGDKVASVRFDNSKPMFTKAVLSTSEATTLTLTTQETTELLKARNSGIKDYIAFRSSGYRASLKDIESIKDKLGLSQYQQDIEYVNNNKVSSIRAQVLLGKARKVVIDTNTLNIISDNNASYQVLEYVTIE